ncbi:MAG: transposase [bacterium]|nr:transposase [bacterium]
MRTPDHDARLAALRANGCNLGLADMTRSSRFDENQLSWTQNWYVRQASVDNER